MAVALLLKYEGHIIHLIAFLMCEYMYKPVKVQQNSVMHGIYQIYTDIHVCDIIRCI